MIDSSSDAIKVFHTVFGIGKSNIPSLIKEGARTIDTFLTRII